MSPHQIFLLLSGWSTIRLSLGLRPVFSPEETTNDEGQYPGVDMGETRLPRREASGDRELEDESQDELYQ